MINAIIGHSNGKLGDTYGHISLQAKLDAVDAMRIAWGRFTRTPAYCYPPVYTVQGWERRRTCPLHVKLIMMELLGQWSPSEDIGVTQKKEKEK